MNRGTGVSHRANAGRVRWQMATIAATLVLFLATTGMAAHAPNPILVGRWNQNQNLPYSWRSGSTPAGVYQAAINAAATDASSTRGSAAATFSYASGASNLIGYGAGATCGPRGIACFSRNPTTSFTMWMREQGHVFDWGSLRWCQAYTTWPDGCFDVETIMLDEFGHVEILDHHVNLSGESDYTDAVVQALSRTKPATGWSAHAFGRCDVASLQLQYDMRSWGAKYSTCLNLATTLTLTATPAAVVKGGTTTITATFKVADDASYVRLALNPVGLRQVTLQRRATGTTAWISVGTMANGPASGTYTMSLSLQSRTEFRALFAKPADEGLQAATSPLIAVPVGQ